MHEESSLCWRTLSPSLGMNETIKPVTFPHACEELRWGGVRSCPHPRALRDAVGRRAEPGPRSWEHAPRRCALNAQDEGAGSHEMEG